MPNLTRIKYFVRFAVAHGLYAIGMLQLLQRIVLRQRAVVLMYHRVLTEQEMAVTASHPAIVVKRETFAAQMEFVKKRFRVMTVDEFVEHMEQHIPFQNSSCLITFDDGWKDNYAYALPILRRFEIPAVVFLPVNFIESTRVFWQEQLTYLFSGVIQEIQKNPSSRDRLARILAPIGLAGALDVPSHPCDIFVKQLVRKNKNIPPSLLKSTIEELTEVLAIHPKQCWEIDGFLNWSEVESMRRHGITFGGHGAEHHVLTAVSGEEAEQEILTAKKVLDTRLHITVPTFSYPNGDWSREIARLVEKAGFRVAFTTEAGHVRCDDDRFTVRRINIFEEDTKTLPLFLARIVGLF